MKIVIAIVLLAVTVVSGNVVKVDWTKVKPVAEYPGKPLLARLQNDAQGRITNGQTAERNQFPYQAALDLLADKAKYFCGGSVLNNRWVLTAAHCAEIVSSGVDVSLGTWNRFDSKEKGQQKIHVKNDKVFVHEKWNPVTTSNDIALIKLPVEIEFNEYVQPIKLPKKSNKYQTYEGEKGIISGWGKISDGGTTSDKLQWLEVPVMKNSGCSPWYAGTITENQICIKTTGGKSTCNGDSGGPLAVMEDGSPTLIGATSFGISLGCESGWPGVFTRISSYMDWIDEIMKNN